MHKGVKIKTSLHNRFDIVKKDIRTGEEKPVAYAENIILDSIWNPLLVNDDYREHYFDSIAFGSGTGTLDAGRTTLFDQIAYKAASNTEYEYDLNEGWISCRKSCVLPENEHNGETLTEVGIRYDYGSCIVTHALLQDMNGNPTSIEKTDTDIITIYATVYVRWAAMGYQSGKIRVNIMPDAGDVDDQRLLKWLLGMQKFMYGITSKKLVFSAQCNGSFGHSIDGQDYVMEAVDYSRTVSEVNRTVSFYARLGASVGNSALGIRSVSLAGNDSVLLVADLLDSSFYTPAEIVGEQIGTGDGAETNFKTAFGHIQSGVKVYVDGIEQTSGVTVIEDAPANNDLGPGMLQLPTGTTSERAVLGMYSDFVMADGVFVNTLFASYGIYSIWAERYSEVWVSNDMGSWTMAGENTTTAGTIAIPSEYRNYVYWKIVSKASYAGWRVHSFLTEDLPANGANIIFDTAPALDAVITVDYTPGVAAKDENHVLDFTFTLEFGEHTPT